MRVPKLFITEDRERLEKKIKDLIRGCITKKSNLEEETIAPPVFYTQTPLMGSGKSKLYKEMVEYCMVIDPKTIEIIK